MQRGLSCLVVVTVLVGVGGTGCVTSPKNGDSVADRFVDVTFEGYSSYASRKVCVYANRTPTGSYTLVGSTTSSSTASSLNGVTGYQFSFGEQIPGTEWACDIPYDRTLRTYVLIEQRTTSSGSCNQTPGGSSQAELDYTYETGTNLNDCYNEAGNVYSMPAECGNEASYAPVIRVVADAVECDPDYCTSEQPSDPYCQYYWPGGDPCIVNECVNHLCEATSAYAPAGSPCDSQKVCNGLGDCLDIACQQDDDCDDENDCTLNTCASDFLSCDESIEPDGTSCSGGTNYICESGECVPPLCEDVQSLLEAHSCSPGETAYQAYPAVWPGGIGCLPNPPAAYCFVNNCGMSFQFWAAYDTQSKCENANPNFVWYAVNPGGICSGGVPADCRARNQQ